MLQYIRWSIVKDDTLDQSGPPLVCTHMYEYTRTNMSNPWKRAHTHKMTSVRGAVHLISVTQVRQWTVSNMGANGAVGLSVYERKMLLLSSDNQVVFKEEKQMLSPPFAYFIPVGGGMFLRSGINSFYPHTVQSLLFFLPYTVASPQCPPSKPNSLPPLYSFWWGWATGMPPFSVLVAITSIDISITFASLESQALDLPS